MAPKLFFFLLTFGRTQHELADDIFFLLSLFPTGAAWLAQGKEDSRVNLQQWIKKIINFLSKYCCGSFSRARERKRKRRKEGTRRRNNTDRQAGRTLLTFLFLLPASCGGSSRLVLLFLSFLPFLARSCGKEKRKVKNREEHRTLELFHNYLGFSYYKNQRL